MTKNNIVFLFVATFLVGCGGTVIIPEGFVRGNALLEGACAEEDGVDDRNDGCSVSELFLGGEASNFTQLNLITNTPIIESVDFLENGIQGRITNSGFDFIESELLEIINLTLSNGIGDTPHICIPPTDTFTLIGDSDNEDTALSISLCHESIAGTCDGVPGCRIDLDIDSLNILPSDDPLNNDDRLDNDIIGIGLTLDVGLGVVEEDDPNCERTEPPIRRICEGIDNCNCGAAGSLNSLVKSRGADEAYRFTK